jgi:hypothetical protein
VRRSSGLQPEQQHHKAMLAGWGHMMSAAGQLRWVAVWGHQDSLHVLLQAPVGPKQMLVGSYNCVYVCTAVKLGMRVCLQAPVGGSCFQHVLAIATEM